ncbi:MAG: ABC transporter permease [Actinobacteria bacterium]|nr:ABC transporter permease [Actinomycetota bacterium]
MATEARSAIVALKGAWGVFRGESSRWLGLRGLFHLIFWMLLIDGLLYFTVVTKHMPFGGLGFESLIGMLAVFPILAAIVLTEAMVIGEYHSGIASWTVSKPVPRSGYVIGKLAALWVALSAIAIFIPGLVAYWWLPKVQPYRFVIPEAPPLGRFFATLLLLSLAAGFFVTLTGFLGTLIRRRGVVALIGLLVWVILRTQPRALWDGWDRFTPSGLIGADIGQWFPVAKYVYGDPLVATSAVAWTIVAAVAFTVGAATIYQRLEL